MAIVEVSDLATYLKRTIDGDNEAAAQSIIDGLEADLEAYLKRPLTETTVTAERVKVNGRGRIYSRSTPVRSVTSLTVDGQLVGADLYKVEAWGVGDIWYGFLPSPLIAPAPDIRLTYVAGLPGEDPEDPFTKAAKAAITRIAARDYNQVVREDLAGVRTASIEGTSLSFVGTGGWNLDELERFKRWKRRIVR